MRLVIDMQGAQSTGSRERGIGRYTLALVDALISINTEHEIILVLNGLFPETIAPLRARFGPRLGPDGIAVWTAPAPASSLDDRNRARREAGEVLREAFIASLAPDIVLNTSLFEGLGDDAITSVGHFPSRVPTAAILYDLIPLAYRETYLSDPNVAVWYARKLLALERSTHLLAISDATRHDAIARLALPEDAVTNISAAADSHFMPPADPDAASRAVRSKFGITRPFLLYTGGVDRRKNLERLISAVAAMPQALRMHHQLVIVCSIRSQDAQTLREHADACGFSEDELVLTGYVSEDDLVALYGATTLFVFPSWFEGFGLPVLEAMQCGAPVIGSNRSAVPEVIGDETALFDPFSVEDMRDTIVAVLTDPERLARMRAHALARAALFGWEASARLALTALEEAAGQKRPAPALPVRRPKLAFVSPLPPAQSGIALYAADLLPVLALDFDIEVVCPQDEICDPFVLGNFPVRGAQWLIENAERFDHVLYQFGNSHFHAHMFDLLDAVPGVVVLHDFFLSGVSHYREAVGENPGGFWRDLYTAHGYPALAARAEAGHIDDVIGVYPTNRGVLNAAQAVIVHSEHSAELLAEHYGVGRPAHWHTIPLLRKPADALSRADARMALGLAEGEILMTSFGHVAETKMNVEIIAAFEDLARREPLARLVFVGQASGEYGEAVDAAIAASEAPISVLGWTEDADYARYLAASDIAIQLRRNSRGETSAAVLDAMGAGLPTIVNACGSMRELPPETVFRLAQDPSTEALVAAMTRLVEAPDIRRTLGAAARAHITTHHAPRAVGRAYRDVLLSVAAEPPATRTGVVETAIGRGIVRTPELAQSLSQALARSFADPVQRPQMLYDVTGLMQKRAGPERDALREKLVAPNDTFRFEPVYRDSGDRLRYARAFSVGLIAGAHLPLEDEPVDFGAGDVLVSAHDAETAAGHDHAQMAALGVRFANPEEAHALLFPEAVPLAVGASA